MEYTIWQNGTFIELPEGLFVAQTDPIYVAQGFGDTLADRWFANSSPVWTGITARILRGFQGVHPNA